jgi:maltose O-acetyltransferase
MLIRIRAGGGVRIGSGVRFDGMPWISNRGRLVIRDRTRVSSVPVQSHLVVGRGGAIEIGADVSIGHGAAIAAHGQVWIGDGSRLAPFVSISDSDFHVVGRRDGQPEVTPVIVGREVVLGARVTLLRGTVIGDRATVLAGSVVSGTVPAGAVVVGVPARARGNREEPAGSEPAGIDGLPVVVAEALGCREPISPDTRPADLVEWDSLGSLRVLLALEEAYGVTLGQEGVACAQSIGDLAVLVQAAREPQERA